MTLTMEGTLDSLGTARLVRLPLSLSQQLPSRGMVMVQGTLNGTPFTAPLEPDGKGGHWMPLDDDLLIRSGLSEGETARLTLHPVVDWPRPLMPADIMEGFQLAGVMSQWTDLTPKAQWEWLRWIRSTANPATRTKRIYVAGDKLSRGDRRPCCFNAAGCTVPEVSKGGVLRDS